jgi:uncharacterized protein (TIGR02118 family)
MLSVVVLYPNQPSSRFDMEYYADRHLPLVRQRLAPMGMRSLSYTVIADTSSPFRLLAELRFEDKDSANRALAAHGPETQDDIPNFTDVTPIILIGETQSA